MSPEAASPIKASGYAEQQPAPLPCAPRPSLAERFLATPEGRLYRAAKDGDLNALHCAREEGSAIDVAHPEFGSPPLVIAALHGHMECVHYLLEEGAEIEQRNKFGWSALHAATSRGQLTLSGYLVARNAQVDVKDSLGRTPLHNAVAAGCDELAKGLIDERADVNAKTICGKTVLSIELGRPNRNNRELENLLTSNMGLPFPKGHVREMLGNRPSSFALLFPGQGSQRLGMLGWTEDHETAWPLVQKANAVLGYDLFKITELGPESQLDRIDICQPAVFVAAMCGIEWMKDQEGQRSNEAAATAGMSSGELAALCAAGCFDFEDGVSLAKVRGELQLAAATSTDEARKRQKMLSVIGLEEEELQRFCSEAVAAAGPSSICRVGNQLFPGGCVISGTAAAVDLVKCKAKDNGAQKVSELKGCAAAFHTELMQPAVAPLREHLGTMVKENRLRSPLVTVYSSQSGQRWLPGTPPTLIADGLLKGLISTNSWEKTCRAMIDDGVDYLWEIGPMKQLKAMMRHIDQTQWKNMKCVDC